MRTPATPPRAAGTARAAIHLALIATVILSLILEPTLGLHLLFGFAFMALVVAHLTQRRRTSRTLVVRLVEVRTLLRPTGRLALSDALLVMLTLAMFGTGLWDWLSGHPTQIRWHALTGVALTGYLVIHTVRRRRRLTRSRVR